MDAMEGEALPTDENVYHVQDGEMINMVGCLEPMVDSCGEMMSRYAKLFWDSIMLRVE